MSAASSTPIFFCGSKKRDNETDISGQSDIEEPSDVSVDDVKFSRGSGFEIILSDIDMDIDSKTLFDRAP